MNAGLRSGLGEIEEMILSDIERGRFGRTNKFEVKKYRGWGEECRLLILPPLRSSKLFSSEPEARGEYIILLHFLLDSLLFTPHLLKPSTKKTYATDHGNLLAVFYSGLENTISILHECAWILLQKPNKEVTCRD